MTDLTWNNSFYRDLFTCVRMFTTVPMFKYNTPTTTTIAAVSLRDEGVKLAWAGTDWGGAKYECTTWSLRFLSLLCSIRCHSLNIPLSWQSHSNIFICVLLEYAAVNITCSFDFAMGLFFLEMRPRSVFYFSGSII